MSADNDQLVGKFRVTSGQHRQHIAGGTARRRRHGRASLIPHRLDSQLHMSRQGHRLFQEQRFGDGSAAGCKQIVNQRRVDAQCRDGFGNPGMGEAVAHIGRALGGVCDQQQPISAMFHGVAAGLEQHLRAWLNLTKHDLPIRIKQTKIVVTALVQPHHIAAAAAIPHKLTDNWRIILMQPVAVVACAIRQRERKLRRLCQIGIADGKRLEKCTVVSGWL